MTDELTIEWISPLALRRCRTRTPWAGRRGRRSVRWTPRKRHFHCWEMQLMTSTQSTWQVTIFQVFCHDLWVVSGVNLQQDLNLLPPGNYNLFRPDIAHSMHRLGWPRRGGDDHIQRKSEERRCGSCSSYVVKLRELTQFLCENLCSTAAVPNPNSYLYLYLKHTQILYTAVSFIEHNLFFLNT